MIKLSDYVSSLPAALAHLEPWRATGNSENIIISMMEQLSTDYVINNGNAIHRTAVVEIGSVLKSPCIIGPNCFIASYAYLRGGVWLEDDVVIGPSSEIKSSFIFKGSKAAHFNFVGDSVIGRNVNIEAGVIIANYRNESEDKEIICVTDNKKIKTGVEKFGSLIGDGCKLGANTVLAPGTILQPKTFVKRLSLVDQWQSQ